MPNRIAALLYDQPDASFRLGAMRLSLVATVGITIKQLPPGSFFEEHRDTVGSLVGTGRLLGAEEFERLRTQTLASLALWGATGSRPAGLLAAAQFARLNEHVAAFFPKMWSYNSHLNVFMLLVGALNTSDSLAIRTGRRRAPDPRVQSLVLALLQLNVGVLYFQSAVSKLRHGGVAWMTSGQTLRASTAMMGTPLGHWLYREPRLFRAFSIATVAIEAAFLPALIIGWPDRRLIAAAAGAFHLGAAAVLGISFWHLWALFPALFLAPSPRELQQWRQRRADPKP
jgi:hypothetical protein